MIPLISARRAAENFARVVDGSQADVADRYASLTATVELLRAQPPPAARPEFVADLRSRLMVAADTALVPAEPGLAQVISLPQTTRRRERHLATLAASVVIVGGTVGVAAAAEHSLPGDALYPIKRGIESAQFSLNSSDAAKGHDLIDQATTRLEEVDRLLSHGASSAEISNTLESFQRSAADGADLLFVAYQRDGDSDSLADLRSTLSSHTARLATLRDQAPAAVRPDFASAAALLSDLDQQARVLCSCGPDDGTDVTNLSSTPAFTSLLTRPAQAAAADQLRSQAKALADKAGQIASNTPNTPLQTPDTTTGTGTGTGLPAVEVPSKDPAVPSTVTATHGVDGLLDSVSTGTGGILAPTADSVTDSVDTVTKLLLGP